jgi:hypothetical protein
MDTNEPTAAEREVRFEALVEEFSEKLRRMNPPKTEDELREMAESMAQMWLLDEEKQR